LDFPTIVFMQSGYNVYTLLQAARRSWRIGQKQDVNIYFLGYANTSQIACLQLMSKKITVSQSTSGDMPECGLDILNQSEDSIEVALAKQLLSSDAKSTEDEKSAKTALPVQQSLIADTEPLSAWLSKVKAKHNQAKDGFLVRHFGRFAVQFEQLVYQAMSMICPDYIGGIWQFYELPKRPKMPLTPLMLLKGDQTKQLSVRSPFGHFTCELSMEATSITANILALCWLYESVYTQGEQTDFIVAYADALKDAAVQHAEYASIYNIID
jgi:Antirestriction protein